LNHLLAMNKMKSRAEKGVVKGFVVCVDVLSGGCGCGLDASSKQQQEEARE
jgi:hypothetical protein